MHSRLCKQYITFHFNFTEIKPLKLQKLQCTINFLLLLQIQQAQPLTSNKQWWTWTYVLMMWTDGSIKSLWCVTLPNVGLMSTRVWPHAMTLSSQNGSPIQFSDSMFRTESMIQSNLSQCIPITITLTSRGLGSVNTCIKDLIWPS